ncbi:hypothetical protein GGR57DRAFT_346078 [Xylariaceae sp. FL1272]|nr:hypothetical protein GGR57DRAFT_346078 [Xylariaceae sp. FL1272]
MPQLPDNMAEIASPTPTPKRKRDETSTDLRLSASPTPHHQARQLFSFQPPSLHPPVKQAEELAEDGSSSPRSKVAQRFRDLRLDGSTEGTTTGSNPDSGGGAVGVRADHHGRVADRLQFHENKLDTTTAFRFNGGDTSANAAMQVDREDDDTTRKRTKFLGDLQPNILADVANRQPISESNKPDKIDNPLWAVNSSQGGDTAPAVAPNLISGTAHGTTSYTDFQFAFAPKDKKPGLLQKSYPSINRLSDSKSRSRKRTGTPPPSSKRKGSTQPIHKEDEEPVIIDPIRAALTWREDEITIYDPEDQDDDGTGINGIGFRPTPAVAYQRAQKRRQQLAEYKKREESDARARRNQRRREQPAAELSRRHSAVRVHFSDAEPTTVITT